jgi:hypothetical protein
VSATVTNLIAGPGTLYVGAFGATEPADSTVATTPSASTWTDVGGTQDGVQITVNLDYFELEVDQVVDIPGRRLTKRDVQVKTNMAEATLTNLGVALNGGTVTASATYSTYDPADNTAATQLTYKAAIFDGWAPQTAAGVSNVRRVVVRKVLSIDNVETSYKKDDQTLFPVTFGAHYVSSVIKPFRVIDQTA